MNSQSVRSYASEAAPKSGSYTPWIVGAAAVGAGLGGYSFLGNKKVSAEAAPTTDKQPEKTTKPAFTGGDQGFIDLKLKEAKDYNHNTKTFIFELPSPDHISGMNTASAVITKYKAEDQEKPTIRPYTPTSHPDEKGTIELLVKKYPNGPMSEHIHSLKPGDTLSMKGPIPKYPWSPNKHDHITCIAGGTGITPMYQLIQTIFKNPEDKTKVSLVFGNISEDDILLREEFDKIEKANPKQFKVFHMLDKPSDKWEGGKGHVTKEVLKEVVPDAKSENIKVFVCGPPGLYKAVSGPKVSPTDQGDLGGILKELGYTKEQVYKF
jgi:cytochrome-b5 reductase